MAKDASAIRVAANGSISVADVGADLPEDLDPLDAAFVDLGLITPEGVSSSDQKTVEEIRSWQSPYASRRIVTDRSKTLGFSLQQFSQDAFELAYEGEWSEPSPGVFRFDPPAADDPLGEKSYVLDWEDGDINHRVVIPKANVTEGVETALTRTGAVVLPITISVNDDGSGVPWYHLSDDPALEPAS